MRWIWSWEFTKHSHHLYHSFHLSRGCGGTMARASSSKCASSLRISRWLAPPCFSIHSSSSSPASASWVCSGCKLEERTRARVPPRWGSQWWLAPPADMVRLQLTRVSGTWVAEDATGRSTSLELVVSPSSDLYFPWRLSFLLASSKLLISLWKHRDGRFENVHKTIVFICPCLFTLCDCGAKVAPATTLLCCLHCSETDYYCFLFMELSYCELLHAYEWSNFNVMKF